jgi:hypothetical protein
MRYRQHVLMPVEAEQLEFSSDVVGEISSDHGWFWFSGVRIETTHFTAWSVVQVVSTELDLLRLKVRKLQYAVQNYPTYVGPVYDRERPDAQYIPH